MFLSGREIINFSLIVCNGVELFDTEMCLLDFAIDDYFLIKDVIVD